MIKKTPLYENHVAHGGKMVEFAGYFLPVQYQSGIIAEHNAVRTNVGMFDVSGPEGGGDSQSRIRITRQRKENRQYGK